MLVILDSTVLVADRFLHGNNLRLLLNAARRSDPRVAVTEVSVLEAINKVRENAEEALGRIDKGMASLKKLGALTADFVTDVTSTAVAADYERFLRQALNENAVEVLPIPDIAHDEVVRRALQRRKPFDPEGQKGYRDALIWATIKQAAVDTGDDIAFVSANHRDFADSGKKSGLARALTDELLEAGVAGTVELSAEAKSFVDVGLRPAAEALAELNLRLTGDTTFRAELERAFDLAIENDDVDLSGLDVRLLIDERWTEYELAEAFLHAVSPGVTHIEILSARSLGDDEVLLDLVAEGDAEIDFRARRIAGGWPLGDPDGFDPDNPPRVIRGTKTRTLRLSAEAHPFGAPLELSE